MDSLDAAVEESHRALDAFFKGDANPVKPFFSHRDDVTLANPFGPPQRGWDEVEHYQAKVGGSDEVTPVSLRCTTIFRREGDAWKIVHRHADPITAARPAEWVVQR